MLLGTNLCDTSGMTCQLVHDAAAPDPIWHCTGT